MTEQIATVENTEIATAATPTVGSVITSFDVTTEEGLIKAYNASMASDERVEDNVGKVIDMSDYYVGYVELENEKTGELEIAPAVVIFATDGTTYGATSKGIEISLKNMTALFAKAHKKLDAEHPVRVQFVATKAKRGQMFSLKMIPME